MGIQQGVMYVQPSGHARVGVYAENLLFHIVGLSLEHPDAGGGVMQACLGLRNVQLSLEGRISSDMSLSLCSIFVA